MAAYSPHQDIGSKRGSRLSSLPADDNIQLLSMKKHCEDKFFQPIRHGGEPAVVPDPEPVSVPEQQFYKHELCELAAYIVPPLVNDLLKLLVADKHGPGVTVKDVLQKKELGKTEKLLRETNYLHLFHDSYYLLPVNERGQTDPDRENEDPYLLPVDQRGGTAYETLSKDKHSDNTEPLYQPIVKEGEESIAVTNGDYGMDLGVDRYQHLKEKTEDETYKSALKEPTPEEVAQIYHLLRQEEMTGLEAPPNGWFKLPGDNEERNSSTFVALVTYVSTNINEFLDQTDSAIEQIIERLDEAVENISSLLDKSFPRPKRLSEQISYYKGIKNKPEIFDYQWKFLQDVAFADRKLMNITIDVEFEEIIGNEDIYEEIIENVYDEITLPAGDQPSVGIDENLHPNKGVLGHLEDINQDLIETAISVSTMVQESGENISTESKEQAFKISKNIGKAKKVAQKVLDVIKEEIQKIRDRIAHRTLEIKRRKLEKRRQQADKRKQKVPLPDLPAVAEDNSPELSDDELQDTDEDFDEIVLDDEHIYDELAKNDLLKLQALMDAEEKNEFEYVKLCAVDELLDEVITEKEKWYYTQLIERHLDLISTNLTFQGEDKQGLVEERVISIEEWNNIRQIKENTDQANAESLLKTVLEKGDYGCKRFIEYLRQYQPEKYSALWDAEQQWKSEAMSTFINDDDSTIRWDTMITIVAPSRACTIMHKHGMITDGENHRIFTTDNDNERREALREVVITKSKDDWDRLIGILKYEEKTTKEIFEIWDDLDWLANWKVIMKNLDLAEMCSILFSRFIISPRQYADLNVLSEKYRKWTALEVILIHKDKGDWQVFINTLKDKGQGHMFDQLKKEQEEASSGNIKVYKIDGQCLESFKWRVPSKFTVDTKRNFLLFWSGLEVKCIPLTDETRKPRTVLNLVRKKGQASISCVCYDVSNDLYILTQDGQPRITLYDPKENKEVRILTDNNSIPEAIATGASNQIIVLSKRMITRYDITGQRLAQHSIKPRGSAVLKKVSTISLDHQKRIIVCDTGSCRLMRIREDDSWEHSMKLPSNLSAIHVGQISGSVVSVYRDGVVNLYNS